MMGPDAVISWLALGCVLFAASIACAVGAWRAGEWRRAPISAPLHDSRDQIADADPVIHIGGASAA